MAQIIRQYTHLTDGGCEHGHKQCKYDKNERLPMQRSLRKMHSVFV